MSPVLLIWDEKKGIYTTCPQQFCRRCGLPALQSWNICADDNRRQWVCENCDLEINEWMLKFIGFRNWKWKMRKYKNHLDEFFKKPE